MNPAVDFILPSCPGIPETMWSAASSMIDEIIKRSWFFLGTFVTIQLISQAFIAIAHGKLNIGAPIRTLLHAFLIACFFKYYKDCLMFFDGFIDQIANVEKAVLDNLWEKGKGRMHAHLNPLGFLSIRNVIKTLVVYFASQISLLTHEGAIYFMHFIKAVTLLIMSQLGPLSALFSLLPGPFKKGWSSWMSSYIHVSCWSITLKLFLALSKAFATAATTALYLKANTGDTFFSETVGYTFLSYILLVSIFLTPAWTAKFMGPGTAVNLGAALGLSSPSSVVGTVKKYIK